MHALRTTAVAVVTVAAIIGVGACTSGGGGGASSTQDAAHKAAPAAGADVPGRIAAPTTRSGDSTDDPVLGSAKIRTADMTVTVKRGASVGGQADAAEAIALQVGGEVDADERASGRFGSAVLVLGVPPDRLSAVLAQLARLGVEKARHLSTEDVTAKVADVNSRVVSARDAIARLRDLYARATKIADVITVESELSERESDLESLEAQQRALTAQTSTATITLTLNAPPTPVTKPPAKQHRTGFLGGVRNGWDAFSHGAAELAAVAGAVLPFALLALVLFGVWRLLWPRLRGARTVAPRPTPEP